MKKSILKFITGAFLIGAFVSLNSCTKSDEEKFVYVGVSLNQDILQDASYGCPVTMSPSSFSGETFAQVAIPRSGGEDVNVAHYSGIPWFGLVVDLIGKREDGSTATLYAEDQQYVLKVSGDRLSWGGHWQSYNNTLKLDRLKMSKFKEFKAVVSYVTPCRDCWSDELGTSAREIWKGESDWMANTEANNFVIVDLDHEATKTQNNSGHAACN